MKSILNINRSASIAILALSAFGASALLASACAVHAEAKSYPPVSAYQMPKDKEIALARTAAPENISGPATIKLLTPEGFKVEQTGNNGFTCMVMRGFSAPTYTPEMFVDLVYDPGVLAPICFSERATKEVMPYYELRTKLGLMGQSPTEIRTGVEAAYASGDLPKRTAVSFGYMWSAEQNLASGIGHWHPHLMIFSPGLSNDMVGNNMFGSPMPQVTDDAGTPFSVIVVPVDHALAQGFK
jgi:hypothetical protein